CAACHDPGATPPPGVRLTFPETSRHGAFPAPVATACASCHVDVHEGALADAPDGGACAGCHGQDAWLPADYGIARHNREARFLLEGAHRAVACEACHRPGGEALVLEPPADGCVTCHAADDPHQGQFVDRRCEECHTVSSFRIEAFDHDGTRFPLDGAHADVSCAACHPTERSGGTDPFVRYLPLGTRCADCHGESR
ncbi:MAG TPA: hypothetical protein VLL48_07110, partial [Longimicrobiales bacterium]|nr:hypothetical protein [Longimicrobiales bacterium]